MGLAISQSTFNFKLWTLYFNGKQIKIEEEEEKTIRFIDHLFEIDSPSLCKCIG